MSLASLLSSPLGTAALAANPEAEAAVVAFRAAPLIINVVFIVIIIVLAYLTYHLVHKKHYFLSMLPFAMILMATAARAVAFKLLHKVPI